MKIYIFLQCTGGTLLFFNETDPHLYLKCIASISLRFTMFRNRRGYQRTNSSQVTRGSHTLPKMGMILHKPK